MFELTIPFPEEKGTALYEHIYAYIKDEIKQNKIPAGTRLPSTRKLAEHLGISRTTVQLSYDQLLSEGYLESVPYKGYYVSRLEELLDLGVRAEEEEELPPEEKPAWDIDFSPRGIDLESFPYTIWRKLSRGILTGDNRELFTNGDNQGDLPLRQAICRYLFEARGVNCKPEQLIVGAGSEYLLMLLNQILGRKRRIAIESPSYMQAYQVLKRLGQEILPVPMDENGISIKALEASAAESVYVMPSHQFPTGIVMPIRRRTELLSWAMTDEERYIIEDDYDSEFRYKGKPIPSLQSADRNGKVIYLGTFSRSVAPAIRVSYMMLPLKLLEKYRTTCSFYTSTVSRVDQAVLTQFIQGGFFERHLNKMRSIYKAKHDLLLEELEPLRKHFRISGEYAGMHLLLTAADPSANEDCLVRSAEEAGVRVYGLSRFYTGERSPEGHATILLGYANMSEEEIRKGARILREAYLSENAFQK